MTLWRLAACGLLTIATIQGQTPSPPILFEGGRIIADARRPPIENAALLVDRGRVVNVGRRGDVKAPSGTTRVDFTGKTIIPALIDAHVHLGYQVGLNFAAENFTRETLVDQLNRYAYAGIAAVASLGTEPGELPAQIRAEQTSGTLGGALFLTAGRGIAAPNAGPGTPELKAAAYGVTTEDEARRAVREQVAHKVDFVKIWVDDRNGTVPKLSPALYRAVIAEAHKLHARVIAHIFYLDDAKDLARAGIDAFAHLVRDKEVDQELVALMIQHHVAQMPNIAISENAIHAEAPAWLDAPLLHEVAPAAVIDRIRASYARRPPDAVARARATYTVMERSMATLMAAGVTMVLGTDDGAVRDHVYAFTAHRELTLLAHAGMPPARVLDVATRATAEFLRLTDLGTLAAGKRADFIVLTANPLHDVANTQKIDAVYARGVALDRAALRSAWK
ncbi:MAG TPA: amidohydrolase family protein [Vicinamibacterales bacterium]|nr:amidohydrolase family protein [Vicinamibacterales bacterium]